VGQGLVSKNLTELSLNTNNLGDQGCAALAKALASSPALKRLDLSGNSIGDKGGADVAKALATNSTLTFLSLENNCIADHAGVGIAQALSHNNALLSLSLKANLLRDTTGEALVVGLRTNDTLTELDVSWNDINYTNHQSLEALIQEQANRYRDASVARLRLELERLRRMEPRLAIREAELRYITFVYLFLYIYIYIYIILSYFFGLPPVKLSSGTLLLSNGHATPGAHAPPIIGHINPPKSKPNDLQSLISGTNETMFQVISSHTWCFVHLNLC